MRPRPRVDQVASPPAPECGTRVPTVSTQPRKESETWLETARLKVAHLISRVNDKIWQNTCGIYNARVHIQQICCYVISVLICAILCASVDKWRECVSMCVYGRGCVSKLKPNKSILLNGDFKGCHTVLEIIVWPSWPNGWFKLIPHYSTISSARERQIRLPGVLPDS